MNSLATSARPGPEEEPDHSDDVAIVRTVRFVYQHVLSVVAISVAWTLLSLPVVTIGPATLGAYAAVTSLRERGSVDPDQVRATVRPNLVAAVLLGLGPPVFGSIGVLYVLSPPGGAGPLSLLLTAVAVYAGVYLAVVLVPTFYEMAGGATPMAALRAGYVSTANDPVWAIRLIVVTATFVAVATVLTVALVLLLPGALTTYHVISADERLASLDQG
jgi:hypothetical protein